METRPLPQAQLLTSTAPQEAQPAQQRPKGSGRVITLSIIGCLVIGLVAIGIAYALYVGHQRSLQQQRQEQEKARLNELNYNVKLFRGDMESFLKSGPTSNADQQGMNVSATGEVGVFEAYFNTQLQLYLGTVGQYDTSVMNFYNSSASLSAIAADRSLGTSNKNLTKMRASSKYFYSSARTLFTEETFKRQLADSSLPASVKNEMLDIVMLYITHFNTTIDQAQQTENSGWDAQQQFLDLLAAHPTSWKISGQTLEWYSQTYYEQTKQLNAKQIDALEKALDSLWAVGGVQAQRSGYLT